MNKTYRLIPDTPKDNYNYNLWYDKDGFHIVLYITNGQENKTIKKPLKTPDLFIARKRRDKILKQLKGKDFNL